MNTRAMTALASGVAAYGAALGWLSLRAVYPIADAFGVLLVLGISGPLLAWGALHGTRPLALSTRPPARDEMLALIALLALVTCYLTLGPARLDALLPNAWLAPGPHAIVQLLRKLIVFVAVPCFAMRIAFRWRAVDFGLGAAALRALWGRQGLAVLSLALLLSVFQWFAGSGAAPLRDGEFAGFTLAAAIGMSFVWHTVEAGLVEEFFFRAILQERLGVLSGSRTIGAVLASLLFGLAHAPGYFLRGAGSTDAIGAQPSLLDALSYSVAVPAVAAVLFAYLWARTRNLYACILAHGAIDTLPNAAPLARALGLV